MRKDIPLSSPSALLRLEALSEGEPGVCGSYKNGWCQEEKDKKCDLCASYYQRSNRY